MKILLVDDEPTVRAIVAELLELDGHIVAQAENGPGALTLLAADKAFDLVLADVGMPRMNGWALAREIKERYPGIRVGLVTGYGETGPNDAQERSVVDFILAKPISEETLRATIPSGGRPS
jgi:CheY-like chemotaxis protein